MPRQTGFMVSVLLSLVLLLISRKRKGKNCLLGEKTKTIAQLQIRLQLQISFHCLFQQFPHAPSAQTMETL